MGNLFSNYEILNSSITSPNTCFCLETDAKIQRKCKKRKKILSSEYKVISIISEIVRTIIYYFSNRIHLNVFTHPSEYQEKGVKSLLTIILKLTLQYYDQNVFFFFTVYSIVFFVFRHPDFPFVSHRYIKLAIYREVGEEEEPFPLNDISSQMSFSCRYWW